MAHKIEWSGAFTVGHAELDAEHTKLIKVINALDDIIDGYDADADDRYHVLLDELAMYARMHFAHEEHVMREINYPLADNHISSHMRYVEFTTEAFMDALAVVTPEQKRTLHNFLWRWWQNHIMLEDMMYKQYIENRAL